MRTYTLTELKEMRDALSAIWSYDHIPTGAMAGDKIHHYSTSTNGKEQVSRELQIMVLAGIEPYDLIRKARQEQDRVYGR